MKTPELNEALGKENFELIKDSIKKLVTNTIWFYTLFLITLVALFWGNLRQPVDLNIAGKDNPGYYILIMCFAISVAMIKNYLSAIAMIKHGENENMFHLMKSYLTNYPSVLNPFSEQKGGYLLKIINHLGYSLMSIAPFLSVFLGWLFLKNQGWIYLFLLCMGFLMAIVLHIEQRLLEKKILRLICHHSEKSKRIMFWILISSLSTLVIISLVTKI